VKAGGDINCGPEYSQLLNATKHGFITEAELDVSVRRLMRRRMQTGDLDALGADGKPQTPYSKIPVSQQPFSVPLPVRLSLRSYDVSYRERTPLQTQQIDTPEHKAVAHKIAQESIVLLTNGETAARQPVLPLDATKIKSLLVVGPTADDITVQAHTYHGTVSARFPVRSPLHISLYEVHMYSLSLQENARGSPRSGLQYSGVSTLR
jgi:beta-glucosidase